MEENGRRIMNVEAAMVVRAVGGALLIAIVAAIVERDLRIGPPLQGRTRG